MSDLPPTTTSPSNQTEATNAQVATNNKQEVHDCWFFLTTGCSKGDQCKFRHKPEVKNVNMLCTNYLRNNCFNPDCPFIHLKSLPTVSHAKPQPPAHPKITQPPHPKECAYFKLGRCKNGDKCPYLHIQDASTPPTSSSPAPSSSVPTSTPTPASSIPSSTFRQGNHRRPQQVPPTPPKRIRVVDTDGSDPLGFGEPQKLSSAQLMETSKRVKQNVAKMVLGHQKKKNAQVEAPLLKVRTRAEIMAAQAAELAGKEEKKKKEEEAVKEAEKEEIGSIKDIGSGGHGEHEEDNEDDELLDLDKILGDSSSE